MLFQNGATGQGYKLGRISAKLLVSNTMEEGRLNINHHLKVNNEMIPPVEIDGSFRYLGKMFSYTMGTDEIRNELKEELTSYLDKVDKLPLHPKNKLLIINKFVYNKLRWRLSVYHLSESWATKSLDGKVIHYVKRWLHFHQGANLTHLKLSVSKFGLGFQLPSDVLKYCKLSMRQVIFKSINEEIQDLFHLTSGNYIHTDSLIVNCERRPRK